MISANVIYEDDPVIVNVDEETYNVVIDNNAVEVTVADVILKETIEYVTEEDEVYDIEVDTSVPNVTYVGQAMPGTPASVASWRIKKITETSTGSSVDWANGAADFVHAWTDHLTLTYGP
jgi:hypothetical protein